MDNREKVIKGLECCATYRLRREDCEAINCTYLDLEGNGCVHQLIRDAITLLKAQEPRLVTETDFENADPYGYLPVWVEDKDDNEIICDCITKYAITEPDEDSHFRYWTSCPTEEQREATPWSNG